jgi:hypothetical protein
MTNIEFVKYINKFIKHPIFVEQEAMIITAMIDGKITKKTAGDLMVKVIQHNTTKLKELLGMDMQTLMKEYGYDS